VDPAVTDEGRDPPGHGAALLEPLARVVCEGLGHLPASLRAVLGEPGEGLQGDFLLLLGMTQAQHVAGLGDPPVVGVEVAVVLDHGRSGNGGDRTQAPDRDGSPGERGQPARGRSQVECVELPLDLDRVGRPVPWCGAHRRRRLVPKSRPPLSGQSARPNAATAGLVMGTVPFVTERTRSLVQIEGEQAELVLAAGGLVVRQAQNVMEVAVVHRPAREDWSFPKGKVERKETLTDCAVREVLEETGLSCRILSFVGTTEYLDRKSRPKVVAYWAMEVLDGSFRASEEVDELLWIELGRPAVDLLTYERDHELVAGLEQSAPWIRRQLRRSA
jgi:8-oxo-dGTP diphosphatase